MIVHLSILNIHLSRWQSLFTSSRTAGRQFVQNSSQNISVQPKILDFLLPWFLTIINSKSSELQVSIFQAKFTVNLRKTPQSVKNSHDSSSCTIHIWFCFKRPKQTDLVTCSLDWKGIQLPLQGHISKFWICYSN